MKRTRLKKNERIVRREDDRRPNAPRGVLPLDNAWALLPRTTHTLWLLCQSVCYPHPPHRPPQVLQSRRIPTSFSLSISIFISIVCLYSFSLFLLLYPNPSLTLLHRSLNLPVHVRRELRESGFSFLWVLSMNKVW